MAKAISPTRPRMLGETTVIAGVTAVAYLVALAYRIGALLRLGLPASLATVRLSDAAFAGLIVLVGGFFAFAIVDLVESWREGTLGRVWRWLLIGSISVCAGLFAIFVVVLLIAIEAYLGIVWAVTISVLSGIMVGLLARRVETAIASRPVDVPRMDALAAILSKHPGPALSVFLSVFLCLGAFSLGWDGTTLLGPGHVRTADEVVIGLSEDRAILAKAAFDGGGGARLTGDFRIVALPSEEVTFSAQRVRAVAPGTR